MWNVDLKRWSSCWLHSRHVYCSGSKEVVEDRSDLVRWGHTIRSIWINCDRTGDPVPCSRVGAEHWANRQRWVCRLYGADQAPLLQVTFAGLERKLQPASPEVDQPAPSKQTGLDPTCYTKVETLLEKLGLSSEEKEKVTTNQFDSGQNNNDSSSWNSRHTLSWRDGFTDEAVGAHSAIFSSVHFLPRPLSSSLPVSCSLTCQPSFISTI